MKPNFKKNAIFVAIALSFAAGFSSGCSRAGAQSQNQPPPSVTVAPVEQKEIVEWNEFTGHTEPVDSVEVRPRVSGYIQEVKFHSGQLVKKGDVLFVIDPRWNQAVYDQRKAQYDQASREEARTEQLLANKAISTGGGGCPQGKIRRDQGGAGFRPIGPGIHQGSRAH